MKNTLYLMLVTFFIVSCTNFESSSDVCKAEAKLLSNFDNHYKEYKALFKTKDSKLIHKSVDVLLQLADSLEIDSFIIKSRIAKATAYIDEGNNELALEWFNRITPDLAIEDYQTLSYKKDINTAILYHKMGKFSEAYFLFEKLSKAKLNDEQMVQVFSNWGATYITAKEYKKAALILIEADILLGNVEVNYSHFSINSNIARNFYNSKNYKNAIKYYTREVELISHPSLLQFNLRRYIPSTFNSLAMCYLNSDSLELAEVMIDSAFTSNIENSLQKGVSNLRRANLLLKKENYNDALKNSLNAHSIFKELNNKFFLLANLKTLINIQFHEKRYEKTSLYLSEIEKCCSDFVAEEDSIFIDKYNTYLYLQKEFSEKDLSRIVKKLENSNGFHALKIRKEIAELQEEHEAEKRTLQINNLNREKKIEATRAKMAESKARRSNQIAAIAFICSLLFLGLIFYLFKQRKLIRQLRSEESHSVQNSYARILGVLDQHISLVKDSSVQSTLNKSKSLVKASAIIHNTINTVENRSKNNNYNFRKGFLELCDKCNNFASFENKIELQTFCEKNISINPNAIQTLFLLTEELITNSAKHAFGCQSAPKIMISLTLDSKRTLKLIYQDNGIGFPPKHSLNDSKSRNFEIIRSLTRKLHGKVKSILSDGLTLEFDFEYSKLNFQ